VIVQLQFGTGTMGTYKLLTCTGTAGIVNIRIHVALVPVLTFEKVMVPVPVPVPVPTFEKVYTSEYLLYFSTI
jgi:hypothetical protein